MWHLEQIVVMLFLLIILVLSAAELVRSHRLLGMFMVIATLVVLAYVIFFRET